jgi:hypothetical protein
LKIRAVSLALPKEISMAQNKFEEDKFEFPDEKEARESKETAVEAASDDVEIEIEDDTPPEDRGRKPAAAPPDEPSEDELASYDEKVQARIKKFTKGYHDERRAKEQALREREAAEAYARQVIDENRRLQQQMAASSKVLVEQSQNSAQLELETAKKKYKEAYEAGDSDALADAQAEVAKATWKLEKAQDMRPLQAPENDVQPVQRSSTPRVTDRDQQWLQTNTWFGTDPEMTASALGLHQRLAQDKGDSYVGSDEYYKVVDATMRRRFPEYFGSNDEPAEEETPSRAQKPAPVVAPATRSTPPNRIRLKASEAAIAKRLGVPLELYAKQVAQLKRNG